MNRATRFALALLAASAMALPTAAWADAPSAKASPVYILSLSTDDSDDQADALTQALRSRVRQASGWSLLETPQSFDTLAIALKCPPRPDAPCLQRIGDQLHADHFVWGTLARAKPGAVKADLHMWSRGKPDVEVVDVYSDNLKDASDEALRGITGSLFGKLSGAAAGATATLVVHAGTGGGEVRVDGVQRGALEGGVARLDVPAGAHSVTVRVPGAEAAQQSAVLASGASQELTFPLGAEVTAAPDSGEHASFPVRKVLEYGAIVVGAGLLIASGVEAAQWISDSNASNADRQSVPRSVTDVCAAEVNAAAQDACRKSKDAASVSTLGWVFGGAGAALLGTGIILLLTDHGSQETASGAAAQAPRRSALTVVPSMGPQGGSVDVRVTF